MPCEPSAERLCRPRRHAGAEEVVVVRPDPAGRGGCVRGEDRRLGHRRGHRRRRCAARHANRRGPFTAVPNGPRRPGIPSRRTGPNPMAGRRSTHGTDTRWYRPFVSLTSRQQSRIRHSSDEPTVSMGPRRRARARGSCRRGGPPPGRCTPPPPPTGTTCRPGSVAADEAGADRRCRETGKGPPATASRRDGSSPGR